MEPSPENQLVCSAQLGCSRALEQLIEHQYPKLLRIARRILRDEEDARDATQEAACKVVQNIHQLQSAAAFASWATMILRRSCFEVLKRRQIDRERNVSIDDGSFELANLGVGSDSAEHSVQIAEIAHSLGNKSLEIVELRLLMGLSVRETAATLGISEGAIKLRLYRARQEALRLA